MTMPREDEITVREAGWPLEEKLDRFGDPMAECPECGEWWSASRYIPARLTRERDEALDAWSHQKAQHEELREQYDAECRMSEGLKGERDEARAEVKRLRLELRQVWARVRGDVDADGLELP